MAPRLLGLVFLMLGLLATGVAPARAGGTNPLIWADVPDLSVIRVGKNYYMSSTTMHLSPGLPIMKSVDLVHWKIVSYAYDILEDSDELALRHGKSAYGGGSWASSLRFHEGRYYVSTFSGTTGRTYVYSTTDIERGRWTGVSFTPKMYDHSLFFEDDGRVFMTSGPGDISLTELNADASGIKPGGIDRIIIRNATAVAGGAVGLRAEGTQIFKVGRKYYLFSIVWPKGGIRTELVFRSDHLEGPYEGRVALSDRGIAQGGIVDTPDGHWYAMLFRDYGAVGRVPYAVPIIWKNGWPVFGVDGKVPDDAGLAADHSGIPTIVASDEFERKPGERALPLVWQFNHNPDNANWSVTEHPGFLRLRTARLDRFLPEARNTLTQRTFGPTCTGSIGLDTDHLKEGDYAGLAAFQKDYGFVGVTVSGGRKAIVMVSAPDGTPSEAATVPLDQAEVYLRLDLDYADQADRALFSYSLDEKKWAPIGVALKMKYTLPHFMGYRFALFDFSTREAGGYADFDYFRVMGGRQASR